MRASIVIAAYNEGDSLFASCRIDELGAAERRALPPACGCTPLFRGSSMAMGALLIPAAFSDPIFRNTTISKGTAFLVIPLLAACGFLLGLIYDMFIKYEYMNNILINRLINTLVGGVVLGAAMGATIVAVKWVFDKSPA